MGVVRGFSLTLLSSIRLATFKTLLVVSGLLDSRPISKWSWRFGASLVHLLRVRTSCLGVGVLRETITSAQVLNNHGPGLEVDLCTIAPLAFVDQFSLLTDANLHLSLSCRAFTFSTHAFERNTIAMELGPWYRQPAETIDNSDKSPLVPDRLLHIQGRCWERIGREVPFAIGIWSTRRQSATMSPRHTQMLLKQTPKVEQAEESNAKLWVEFIVVPFSEISSCQDASVARQVTYILQRRTSSSRIAITHVRANGLRIEGTENRIASTIEFEKIILTGSGRCSICAKD